MEFKLIDFLPENWLHAFGVTLFHSLWLGLVLSLLVAIVVFFTRKATAALRYNLLTGCLFLFVAVIIFTFCKELSTSTKSINISALQHQFVEGQQQINISPAANVQGNLSASLNKVLEIWNQYTAQVVLIWFLIICARSIQLLVGLNGISHLRNNQVYASGKKWDEKLTELCERLGVNQGVEILQSGIAKVPMVVGHFKPLILIPLGLINRLSVLEVEAIICHELAHIRRRDYLVNLIQSFVEIIFFFNPAVLWLSKLIRTERENCCDDLAIANVNDKRNYVKALISCQEFQLNTPEFAMAFSGRKNHLLQRVSRMLFNTKSTLNKMEKTILTIALVSVVICSAAFKGVENKSFSTKKAGPIAILANDNQLQDTSKKKMTDAQKVIINKREAEIKRKMKAQIEWNRTQADSKRKASEIQREIAEKQRTAIKQETNKQRNEEINADKKAAAADLKYAEAEKAYALAQKNYDKDQLAYEKHQLNYNKEVARYNHENKNINTMSPIPAAPPINVVPSAPYTPSTHYAPSAPLTSLTPINTVTAPLTPNQNIKTRTKTGAERVVKSISVTNGDGHDYTDEINSELLKDGIINKTNKLSYKLDKNTLTINGVKQPESVHKKYKEKYLKSDNRSLMYNYEVNSNH